MTSEAGTAVRSCPRPQRDGGTAPSYGRADGAAKGTAPRGEGSCTTVTVAVRATDRVTEDGANAYLRTCPDLHWLPFEERERADVLLFLAGRVGDRTLSLLRRATARPDGDVLPVVLVAEAIGERQLTQAIEYGLVSVLIRGGAGFPHIVETLVESGRGGSRMPGTLVRHLVRHTHARQSGLDDITARTGLEAREIEVLRLLADGLGTGEIAGRLSYSERTIKGVIHDVVKRLGLRNRTHAVVYGVREGII
ncbi:helix-turn-helix transcriptional regulator [Streptomyces scopuliridis]|uniref:helix-turn-helix transcriptional regulator n=1 Tax=Streptomyces scopuliridis TaxID=452529 RepID=UPI0035E3AC03